MDPPLIVTLLLDEASTDYFNRLRQTHFPPAVNYLSAHLTLFHHLPSNEASIEADLQRWAEQTEPFALAVEAVVSIGKGVAYKLSSPQLQALHKSMQQQWAPWLTPQDKQKLWPHVTVLNKVAPAVAKETLSVLQQSFTPLEAQALGFGLWYYEGGPWRAAGAYHFNGAAEKSPV